MMNGTFVQASGLGALGGRKGKRLRWPASSQLHVEPIDEETWDTMRALAQLMREGKACLVRE